METPLSPALAEFCFHVNAGLQLYHDDNVGRYTGVRIHPKLSEISAETQPRLFLIGFQKWVGRENSQSWK